MEASDLLRNNIEDIKYMAERGEYVRIAHLWYGKDRLVTVPNLYYYADKNIETIQGIRAEAAIAFSNSRPAVDTMQIELVVNYARFRSHVQGLMALLQITPVVPILNPLVAALTMPMTMNKLVYAAYGIPGDVIENEFDVVNRSKVAMAYASVPVSCKVDLVNIETIAPRELRLVLRVTRILSASSYGDRTLYVKSFDDAVKQQAFIKSLADYKKDDVQIQAMGAMMGMNTIAMGEMLSKMQAMRDDTGIGTQIKAQITKVLAGDVFKFREIGPDGAPMGEERLGSLYGIEAYLNQFHLSEYNDLQYPDPIKGKLVPQYPMCDYATGLLQKLIWKSSLGGGIVYLISQDADTFRIRKSSCQSYTMKIPGSGDTPEIDAAMEILRSKYAILSGVLAESDPIYSSYYAMMVSEREKTSSAYNSLMPPEGMPGERTPQWNNRPLSATLVDGTSVTLGTKDEMEVKYREDVKKAIGNGTLPISKVPVDLYRQILNTEGKAPDAKV